MGNKKTYTTYLVTDQKGFTLIEILIVIVIIGIITVMGLGFGGKQVDRLSQKTEKEQFVNKFYNTYLHTLNSSYYEGQHFTGTQIGLEVGGQIEINYMLENNENIGKIFLEQNYYMIGSIYLGSIEKNKINIILTPFDIACQVLDTGNVKTDNKLLIGLSHKNKISYCLELETNPCRWEKTDC